MVAGGEAGIQKHVNHFKILAVVDLLANIFALRPSRAMRATKAMHSIAHRVAGLLMFGVAGRQHNASLHDYGATPECGKHRAGEFHQFHSIHYFGCRPRRSYFRYGQGNGGGSGRVPIGDTDYGAV